jgi:hypothetical protein
MTSMSLDWGIVTATVVVFLLHHFAAAALGGDVPLPWHDALHLDDLAVAEQIHLQ